MPATARVGDYMLYETLGTGTFSRVRLGVHAPTGEQVAVKIMDKRFLHQADLTLNVRRELAIMRVLAHPNIVSLQRVLSSRTNVYVVLDLVRGGELFALIARRGEGGLPEPDARAYFAQLVEGVAYCHTRGVVHRDLKPENLLVDARTGTLKITDFGLSSIKGAGTTTELLHTLCGTPNYIPPEVITRASDGYSGEKVDAWACGIILFALLAGYLPFDEPDIRTLFRVIQGAQVTYPPWMSPAAVHLIGRLLDADPAERWSMEQVKSHPWFLGELPPHQPPHSAGDPLQLPLPPVPRPRHTSVVPPPPPPPPASAPPAIHPQTATNDTAPSRSNPDSTRTQQMHQQEQQEQHNQRRSRRRRRRVAPVGTAALSGQPLVTSQYHPAARVGLIDIEEDDGNDHGINNNYKNLQDDGDNKSGDKSSAGTSTPGRRYAYSAPASAVPPAPSPPSLPCPSGGDSASQTSLVTVSTSAGGSPAAIAPGGGRGRVPLFHQRLEDRDDPPSSAAASAAANAADTAAICVSRSLRSMATGPAPKRSYSLIRHGVINYAGVPGFHRETTGVTLGGEAEARRRGVISPDSGLDIGIGVDDSPTNKVATTCPSVVAAAAVKQTEAARHFRVFEEPQAMLVPSDESGDSDDSDPPPGGLDEDSCSSLEMDARETMNAIRKIQSVIAVSKRDLVVEETTDYDGGRDTIAKISDDMMNEGSRRESSTLSERSHARKALGRQLSPPKRRRESSTSGRNQGSSSTSEPQNGLPVGRAKSRRRSHFERLVCSVRGGARARVQPQLPATGQLNVGARRLHGDERNELHAAGSNSRRCDVELAPEKGSGRRDMRSGRNSPKNSDGPKVLPVESLDSMNAMEKKGDWPVIARGSTDRRTCTEEWDDSVPICTGDDERDATLAALQQLRKKLLSSSDTIENEANVRTQLAGILSEKQRTETLRLLRVWEFRIICSAYDDDESQATSVTDEELLAFQELLRLWDDQIIGADKIAFEVDVTIPGSVAVDDESFVDSKDTPIGASDRPAAPLVNQRIAKERQKIHTVESFEGWTEAVNGSVRVDLSEKEAEFDDEHHLAWQSANADSALVRKMGVETLDLSAGFGRPATVGTGLFGSKTDPPSQGRQCRDIPNNNLNEAWTRVLLTNRSDLETADERSDRKLAHFELEVGDAVKGSKQPGANVVETSVVREPAADCSVESETFDANVASSANVRDPDSMISPVKVVGGSAGEAASDSTETKPENSSPSSQGAGPKRSPVVLMHNSGMKGSGGGAQHAGQSADCQQPRRPTTRRNDRDDRDSADTSGRLFGMISAPLLTLFGVRGSSATFRRHSEKGKMGGSESQNGFGCFPVIYGHDSMECTGPWTRQLDSSYLPEKCMKELVYALEASGGCTLKRESVVLSAKESVSKGSLVLALRTLHGSLVLTIDVTGSSLGIPGEDIRGSHVVFGTDDRGTTRPKDLTRLNRLYDVVVERFSKASPGMRVLIESATPSQP